MKKIFLLLSIMVLFFSCKKKNTDPTPIKAPQTYSSKALIEFTTCANCPYCPDGEIYAANMATKYGSNIVYSVAMHNTYQGADNMKTDESQAFSDAWSTGNPTGCVNRITGKCESRSGWDARCSAVTGSDAKCGLAIDATKSTGVNKFDVKVTVGIGATDLPTGKYYLIGYLVNREMSGTGSGWDQANGYNGTVGHACYQKGNPIKNYIHYNVFMKSLAGMNGTLLDANAMKSGALTEFIFPVDLSGLDISKMDVIAYVYFKSVSAPYIENVQKVKLGESKNFD